MNKTKLKCSVLGQFALGALLLIPGVVVAQEPASPPATEEPAAAEPAEAEEDGGIGLNIDLGYSSHYVYRGLNLFGNDQLDPAMLLAPGISWSIFDTGLTLGYWSAWQISGDYISERIDWGTGAEQDLYLTWDYSLSDSLSLYAELYWFFYPGAEEAAAGAKLPNYLMPSVGIYFSTAVDLGFLISYMIGLPDGFSVYNYVYFNPTVGKTFEFNDIVGLELALGFGYKLFTDAPDSVSDNMFDVSVTAAVPIAIGNHVYVSPNVGFAWTNLEGGVDDTGATYGDPGFGDEFVVYGGVNVGADF